MFSKLQELLEEMLMIELSLTLKKNRFLSNVTARTFYKIQYKRFSRTVKCHGDYRRSQYLFIKSSFRAEFENFQRGHTQTGRRASSILSDRNASHEILRNEASKLGF